MLGYLATTIGLSWWVYRLRKDMGVIMTSVDVEKSSYASSNSSPRKSTYKRETRRGTEFVIEERRYMNPRPSPPVPGRSRRQTRHVEPHAISELPRSRTPSPMHIPIVAPAEARSKGSPIRIYIETDDEFSSSRSSSDYSNDLHAELSSRPPMPPMPPMPPTTYQGKPSRRQSKVSRRRTESQRPKSSAAALSSTSRRVTDGCRCTRRCSGEICIKRKSRTAYPAAAQSSRSDSSARRATTHAQSARRSMRYGAPVTTATIAREERRATVAPRRHTRASALPWFKYIVSENGWRRTRA
jgi:hypothetical protein